MQFMPMNAMALDPNGPPLPMGSPQTQWAPVAMGQPQQFFGFAPMNPALFSTNGFYQPPEVAHFETPLPLDDAAVPVQDPNANHNGDGAVAVAAAEEGSYENLTVRIKSGLLRSIEHAENFRNINAFGEADQLSLAMGGIESTTGFYAGPGPKSAFKMSHSNSNTPPFENRYRRDSTDLLDADLQLLQMDGAPLLF